MNLNKDFEDLPETIFDKEFNLNIDLTSAGHAIRDDLAKAYNTYGRLNSMAAYASYLLDLAVSRKKEVEALAWVALSGTRGFSVMKVAQRKIEVKKISIEIEGEKTTILREQERVTKYKYFNERGKYKVKEMSSLLDLGRSMLSWDKTELDRLQ